ncbi:nucleoside deaminase [Plantactinospora endophytica]
MTGAVGRPPGVPEVPEPPLTGRRHRHEAWMRRALEVSAAPTDPGPAGGDQPGGRVTEVAAEALAGDVPVGAVVYGPDGTELSSARNERELTGDPTAHAEVLALRRAARTVGAWRLTGCTLVVTLEPCTMCAGALTLARISTLVFGAWEPKTGAVGSLWDVVRDPRLNHRPEVYGGVLAAECAAAFRAFFR